MEPNARDKWAPYRLNQAEVGPRLLEILGSFRSTQKATPQLVELASRGILLVQPKGPVVRVPGKKRAA
jgi:hypothetical protein